MPFTIRPAIAADHDAIAALYDMGDASASQLVPGFMRAPSEFERPREELYARMVDPACALLVADDERGVVGLIMVTMQDTPANGPFAPRRFAEVVDVVVSVEARREGIASRLMDAAEQWARHQDADSIDLIVIQGNDGAQDLYRRLGYEMRSHRMWKRVG